MISAHVNLGCLKNRGPWYPIELEEFELQHYICGTNAYRFLSKILAVVTPRSSGNGSLT